MDTSQTWNLKTPSSSRKKYKKLSLRKAALSCPPKRAPAPSAADAHDVAKGAKSISPADLNKFTTPPFVTKRRPTYTSSTLIDLSEPGNTPDLFVTGNEYSQNSDPFKTDHNMVFSTPVSNDKTETCDIFDFVKDDNKIVLNNKTDDRKINTNFMKNIECVNNYENSLDVRLNNPNEPNEDCLSPKTANILDDIYGNVWKHTPGLFKKTKSVYKNTQKEKYTSSYDELLNKLDMLNLYVTSLTDVKVKHVQTDIKSFFSTPKDNSSNKIQNSKLLTPKMLSFELTDMKNVHHKDEKDFEAVTLLPDLIPCPNLDDSDFILSTKKVKKTNGFLFSSDSDENIDLKQKKLFNVKESGESDKENSNRTKGKTKFTKKCRNAKKSIEFKVKGKQNCSVIIIESDDQTEIGLDKTSGKKVRKLYKNVSKKNCMFDDVEFVSEDIKEELKTRQDVEIINDRVTVRGTGIEKIPNDFFLIKDKKISTESILKIDTVLKPNEVIEIIDDGLRQTDSDSIITKIHRKFNNVVYDDNTLIDNFISEGIKNISLKTREPNIKTKLIKKAPVKKRAPPKKETLTIGKQQNDEIQVYSFMASLSDNVPSWRCDKEAKSYKDNYAKKKDDLIKKLFSLFNEKVFNNQLDADLPIVWNANLITTAGRAHNKIVRSKAHDIGNTRRSKVELSSKVLDGAQRLRDTLAHELCHVATWLIDGQLKDGHGPCWKKWVDKTLQAFPELVSIPRCHALSIHCKYTYKCIKCGYSIDRHSKSIDTDKKRCGICYGALECMRNRKTKDGLVVSTPVKTAQRAASGFALYVKENYGNVRGTHTPHKQVMQYLGKQYASLKAATPDAK